MRPHTYTQNVKDETKIHTKIRLKSQRKFYEKKVPMENGIKQLLHQQATQQNNFSKCVFVYSLRITSNAIVLTRKFLSQFYFCLMRVSH